MSKRTTFTTISPLPPGITRGVVVDFLHNHQEMIDLNPLVKERHRITPPSHATPEESHCTWYSLTDRIAYLPGGRATNDVTYTCAFHDLPNGIQTHCYAPAGLNIRDKWTLNGSLPGEPVEPVELGTGAPVTGLYIREDVDMKCSILMTSFVKKTLKKSHASLIERLKTKAKMVSETNSCAASTLGHSSSSASSHVSSRSWSSTSSVSSLPASGQIGRPRVHVNTYMPSQSATPVQTLPSTVPLSVFSSAQAQYKLTSALAPQCSQQTRTNYNPAAFTPQHSIHQAYGRQNPELSPVPEKLQQLPPKYRYLPPQQPQQHESPLIPAPLRLRQSSVDSSAGSSSKTAAWSGTSPNGRNNTRAALQSAPSVRYRVAHPDYPQMNPYADDGDLQVRRVGRGFGDVRGGEVSALRGPFVAELEG